jgi:hypothetical protein
MMHTAEFKASETVIETFTVLTMPHNKTVPQVKGDFLLGNLSQMRANPFQALCDWRQLQISYPQILFIQSPQAD